MTIKQYKNSKYFVSDNGDLFKKISPYKTNKGYLNAKLYLANKTITIGMHRLVAELFIDNPNNYNQVNHKDENKINNSSSNLEWCDSKYNSTYGTRIKRMATGHYKAVIGTDEQGNEVRYPAIVIAARELCIDSSSISKALKNKRILAGGYRWRYDKRRD